MAEVTWEIRYNHQARHGVRPVRDFRRWLSSLLREIGEEIVATFRPIEWLPADW